MRAFLISAIVLFCADFCFAQDTLLLMNGEKMVVTEFQDTVGFEYEFTYDKNAVKNLRIQKHNRKLREKLEDRMFSDESFTRQDMKRLMEKRRKEMKDSRLRDGSLNRAEIFSISGSGKTRVLYEPDPAMGNIYSVPEMRDYIQGERDARLNYGGNAAFWSGLAAGLGSGYLLEGRVVSFAVPVAVGLAMRIPVVKVKREDMSSNAYVGNQEYLAGFEDVARNRLMIQGFKGSAIGVVAGLLLYGIINPAEVDYL